MLRTRFTSSAKLLCMSGNEIVSCHGATRLSAFDTPPFALPPPTTRFFHLAVPTCNFVAHPIEPNFFKRLLRKIPIPNAGKYRRRLNGYLLYEDIVHKINYMGFFSGPIMDVSLAYLTTIGDQNFGHKLGICDPWRSIHSLFLSKFRSLTVSCSVGVLSQKSYSSNKKRNFLKSPDLKMPDTFYSWFVITELHVWMLMVRCMAEGQHGQDLRNHIVEAMWDDVNVRKTKLGKASPVTLKKQTVILSQQFNAAIIGYDEGIMSDDKVLAGALWRRFYQSECNNPESIEKLVAYVRKQVNELDKIPGEDIMNMKSMDWLDFRKS